MATRKTAETKFEELDAMDLEMMGLEEAAEEKAEEEKAAKAAKKTSSKKKAADNSDASLLGVFIPDIEVGILSIKVVGDSSLIVHAWSEKAKKQMLEKQMKKATAGRDAKEPFQDYCDSAYWLTSKPEFPTEEDVANAKFGFPAIAFKLCAIDAGYQQGILVKKTTARGAFHVIDEFVEINGTPSIREDMVSIGAMTKTADIRYRMQFWPWEAMIRIRYNIKAISPSQIVNLLNVGGFSNGVGEWRPSRDGSHGTFHVSLD